MGGVGNNLFDPLGTTTRGMVVTILWRLEDKPVSASHHFTDVPSGMWYADAISWASANGIVEGYDGKFDPASAITREQMAAIIYRYTTYKGYSTNGKENISSFTDAGEISDWAEPAVSWAINDGIISGVGNNRLHPAGNAQRAQIATMLKRLIENNVK